MDALSEGSRSAAAVAIQLTTVRSICSLPTDFIRPGCSSSLRCRGLSNAGFGGPAALLQ